MHIFKNVAMMVWEDAQCMAGGAQKWTCDIIEGSVDIDEIRKEMITTV